MSCSRSRRTINSSDVNLRALQLSQTALQAPLMLLRNGDAERLAWGRLLTEQAAELVARVGGPEDDSWPRALPAVCFARKKEG